MSSLFERLRYSGFFFLDRLRGGRMTKAYKEIRNCYQNGTPKELVDQKLHALLDHAVSTTGFYAPYKGAPLDAFPVIHKDTIRNAYDSFLSAPYKDLPSNRKMSTSGSTGTPLTILQDADKARHAIADGIFFGECVDYRIGEKQAFLRVWVRNVNKSPLRLMMENMIPVDTSDLSDDAMREMLKMFREEKVRCLLGYASALSMLSDYIDRTGTDLSGFCIHSIIPISEAMQKGARERLSQQFRCPVRAWYSNEECGIMGVQDDTERYYIDTANLYYEILHPDRDEPVPDGELGRIVITDLNNYAMPLIRYDTGDMAKAERTGADGRERLFLTELYGRRSDLIYDASERPMTPFVVTNNLWDVDEIRQYQLVQTGRASYTMKLNAERSAALENEIRSRLMPYFGEGAKFVFEYVDEIPVLNSGKRKYIVSHYQPS